MSKVVFRIAKLKSWSAIETAVSHNLRTRPTPNAAGPGGFIEVVAMHEPAADAVKKVIGDQTIRKNAVLAVEAIVSASPEYFRPDDPSRAGYWDAEKLQAWREQVEPWIAEKFPHAVSVVLHLDESTPHYQIIDVPLDERGKLNSRAKFGGRTSLVNWQDDAASAVRVLGIERGIAGSIARHERVKAFYGAVNAPMPAIPDVTTPYPDALQHRSMIEQLPMTSAKNDRDELERELAAQIVQRQAEEAAQQAAILKHWPAAYAKANAYDLAVKKQREAEATASRLAPLKTDADKLRALSIDDVLRRMYDAELEPDSRDDHASRKFVLADGRKIAVSQGKTGADVWVEQGGKGQRGAINLVMYLDELDYKSAVRMLASHFDAQAVTSEHARNLLERASAEIKKISTEPVPAPAPDPTHWPRVKRWLNEVRGIPKKLIDMLHDRGLLYADSRGNATFVRANGGAFQRGTTDTPFHRAIGGADCGPFVIPGTDKNVILVEAAIDAVAVKSTKPSATVIASGGDMLPPEKLRKWVPDGSQVFAAHDADKRGDAVAKLAATAFNAIRMRPVGKDWAETVLNEPGRVDAMFRGADTDHGLKTPPAPFSSLGSLLPLLAGKKSGRGTGPS